MAYGYRYGFSRRWKPYVPVAERRQKAAREVAKLEKKGRKTSPVLIEGRAIASTVWGKAWCDALESYSDFENRLPRGRTYVRNGSVIDLQVREGKVSALVSGSAIYTVAIEVKPVARTRWREITAQLSGRIGSLIELLEGRFSSGVMDVLARRGQGLFPEPKELSMECSCPDWATMCKHVAAALYGIGARLDEKPDLLFTLRGVDAGELIARAGAGEALGGVPAAAGAKALAGADLSSVFGIEIDEAEPAGAAPAGAVASEPRSTASTPPKPRSARRKSTPRRRSKPRQSAPSPSKTRRSKPARAQANRAKAKPAARSRRGRHD
jgi:uncharacterized Zn finger protein